MRILSAALMAFALAGCSLSTDAVEPSPHSGIYVLESVNGDGLPWTQQEGEFIKLEAVAGQIELYDGGNFIDRVVVRTTDAGGTRLNTSSHGGTYTVVGDVITFRSQDILTGTIADDAITIEGGDNVAVYRR
jgi:hypothetical protein